MLATCAHAAPVVDISPLVYAPQLPPAKFFASTDPKHQNHDYLELQPGETRRVPLSAGTLARLWSTAAPAETLSLSLQLGGKTVPLLKNNRALQGELHAKAFSFYPRGFVLPANAQLVATNNAKTIAKWFYQATVRESVLPPTTLAELHLKHETSKRNFTLKPGQSVEIAHPTGEGLVSEVRVGLQTPDSAEWDALRLSVEVDRAKTHVVDAPLSALAGRLRGTNDVSSAAAALSARECVLRWPMPFHNGIEISLRNTGNAPVSFVAGVTRYNGSFPLSTFHAAQGSARAQRGKPLQLLDVDGVGAFVGLAMSISPTSESRSRSFAYLEGNEVLTADGRKYEGTGTEDFFNAAWYFPAQPFSQSYGGMTNKTQSPPSVAMYRWMIADAVPFKKSFSFAQEVGSGNNRDDLDYRWTAFWYAAPTSKAQIRDELPTTPNGAATPPVPRDASGGARPDLRFYGVLFSILMAGVAAFFVHRKTRRGVR